jgi:RNA polymerase sigma factor (sigma-70 family)
MVVNKQVNMDLHNLNDNRNKVELASQIFTEYGDFIRAIVLARADNKDQADDIYQDLFLSLASKPIPGNVINIKSYLYRTINNDIADAARRVQRYKAHIQKYNIKIMCSINNSDSRDALIEDEQINKMFNLIQEQLPKSSAQAITLRFRDGRDTKEVAERMGVRRKSVSRYISTGLRRIRKLLSGK